MVVKWVPTSYLHEEMALDIDCDLTPVLTFIICWLGGSSHS